MGQRHSNEISYWARLLRGDSRTASSRPSAPAATHGVCTDAGEEEEVCRALADLASQENAASSRKEPAEQHGPVDQGRVDRERVDQERADQEREPPNVELVTRAVAAWAENLLSSSSTTEPLVHRLAEHIAARIQPRFDRSSQEIRTASDAARHDFAALNGSIAELAERVQRQQDALGRLSAGMEALPELAGRLQDVLAVCRELREQLEGFPAMLAEREEAVREARADAHDARAALLDLYTQLRREREALGPPTANRDRRGRWSWMRRRSAVRQGEVRAAVAERIGVHLQTVEQMLGAWGITAVGRVGEPFDPRTMIAIDAPGTTVVLNGRSASGDAIVSEVIAPGFLQGSTVLRAASVAVTNVP